MRAESGARSLCARAAASAISGESPLDLFGIERLVTPRHLVDAHRLRLAAREDEGDGDRGGAKTGDLLEFHYGFAAILGRSPLSCRKWWVIGWA